MVLLDAKQGMDIASMSGKPGITIIQTPHINSINNYNSYNIKSMNYSFIPQQPPLVMTNLHDPALAQAISQARMRRYKMSTSMVQ
jgi:hypothetical protein